MSSRVELDHLDHIEKKIRELLVSKTRIEVVSPVQNFSLLPGWDSLRYAEFIIALQNEFKIRLSPSEIAVLQNLEAAYRIVCQALNRNT